MGKFQTEHQNIIAMIFFLIGLPLSAQFYTIEMPSVVTTTDSEEVVEPAIDTTEGEEKVDSIVSVADTVSNIAGLDEAQRMKLYQQLVYFDNEVNEQLLELFRMRMEIESARLRERYRGGRSVMNYDYEDGCVTAVTGKYQISEELSLESVLAEILRNNLSHPRVVLAQAVLETGWFKSSVCRKYNNLFGLTNPRTKDYYRFERWQDSVRAYYTKVQYRYKQGNYLRWLREIGYAEDPDYTSKLRVLLDGPLQRYCR